MSTCKTKESGVLLATSSGSLAMFFQLIETQALVTGDIQVGEAIEDFSEFLVEPSVSVSGSDCVNDPPRQFLCLSTQGKIMVRKPRLVCNEGLDTEISVCFESMQNGKKLDEWVIKVLFMYDGESYYSCMKFGDVQ